MAETICPRTWCRKRALVDTDDSRLAICEGCRFAFCKTCLVSWHGPIVRCVGEEPKPAVPTPRPRLPVDLHEALERLYDDEYFDGAQIGRQDVEMAIAQARVIRAWLAGEPLVLNIAFIEERRGRRRQNAAAVHVAHTASPETDDVRQFVQLCLQEAEDCWEVAMFDGVDAEWHVRWREFRPLI